MLEKLLNSRSQVILNKAMDASTIRHEVIANNMANVDTPGFKRSEVLFEEQMKKVLGGNLPTNNRLKCTDTRHIQLDKENIDIERVQPEIRKLEDLSYRNDGNNVDVDVETANMNKNKIYYDSVSQSMSNEIRLLRMAIIGRG